MINVNIADMINTSEIIAMGYQNELLSHRL